MSELIRKQIEKYAIEEWPDDVEMQEFTVEEELKSYGKFMLLSKTSQLPSKLIQAIIQDKDTRSWEERLTSIEVEIEAGESIRKIVAESDIATEVMCEILDLAERENPDWLSHRLYDIEREVSNHRHAQFLTQEVSPRRDLLIALEDIIARSCSNYHADNFRYPLTTFVEGRESKVRKIDDSLPDDALYNGTYEFGANSLEVYKALLQMIKFIEKNYDIDLKTPLVLDG